MSDKITCPVCGEEMENMDHYDGELFYSCSNGNCSMHSCLASESELELRPVDTALRERIVELEAYCDKLAAGLPEGMLPKDVENLREANAIMAQQVHDLKARVTWKRALKVTPPLNCFVLVKDWHGIIKTLFEKSGDQILYLTSDGCGYHRTTSNTCWTEYPDMPEVQP